MVKDMQRQENQGYMGYSACWAVSECVMMKHIGKATEPKNRAVL
jgi:hypothetical protein